MLNVNDDRLKYLDGIRGMASLAVFIWHFFLAFYPAAVMPSSISHSKVLESVIYPSPLNIFFAGDLAVYVFFVLSGFVITLIFFKDDRSPSNMYLRRYVRLMPAAAVSVFFSWFLLTSGFMFNKEAAAITGSWWLSLNWSDIDLTFKNAFYLAFYGTWFDPVTASQQFNSNLGTLFIEIMASFLVYSMIVYFRMVGAQLCHRVSIYILVSIFTFYYFNGNLDFFVFIAGAMLADFSVNYRKFFEVVSRVRWFILSLGVFFATANIGNIPYSEASAFNLYHSVEVVFRSIGIHPLSGPWAIAAVLLLLSLFSFKSLQVFFEKDFIQFLGTHSYSIYLIHTIVIGSFSSGLFVFCHRFCSLDYNSTVFFVFCLTAFVVVMLSHVLLFVDKKAVAISRLC